MPFLRVYDLLNSILGKMLLLLGMTSSESKRPFKTLTGLIIAVVVVVFILVVLVVVLVVFVLVVLVAYKFLRAIVLFTALGT